jgi:hypothetical protein
MQTNTAIDFRARVTTQNGQTPSAGQLRYAIMERVLRIADDDLLDACVEVNSRPLNIPVTPVFTGAMLTPYRNRFPLTP